MRSRGGARVARAAAPRAALIRLREEEGGGGGGGEKKWTHFRPGEEREGSVRQMRAPVSEERERVVSRTRAR